MLDRANRRVVFDSIADAYDAVRPGYPDEVIDRVVPRCDGETEQLLEIGCGSGQATRSLVGRGYQITSIDISPNLLTHARSHFGDRDDLSLVNSSFESFNAPPESFDRILAASSWHWVDPEIGFEKSARLLKPGGHLVIMASLHPRDSQTPFHRKSQEIYHRVLNWKFETGTKSTGDVIRDTGDDMRESQFFESIETIEHRWIRRMTRDEYLRLLSTYSDHYLLPADQLNQFLDEMGSMIDNEFHGVVNREYTTIAFIGRTPSH